MFVVRVVGGHLWRADFHCAVRALEVAVLGNLEAARSGDARRALEELRDTLAGLLDSTEAQVHAQLAAQYRATLADLAALDSPEQKRSAVDELKAKREAKGRRSTADASSNA